MTTAADDRAVEEAFEASLAGRPVRGEAAGLAAFTGAVRGAATDPGRPNAALAELLSTGLLTDQSSPSTRTAPAAGPLPSRSARSRTRRRFPVIVPALIAKLLSAGAVAQAATGAGVVVVVVTGAGTAGVLPERPQQAFDDVVGSDRTVEPVQGVTGAEEGAPIDEEEELPDATVVPSLTSEDVDGTEVALTDAEAAAAWAEDGPDVDAGETYEQWFDEGKQNGWINGRAVSKWVHVRNEERKEAAEAAREAAKAAREAARAAARQGDDADSADDSGSEGSEVEDAADDSGRDEVEDESSDDDGDRSGKGKGKGSGNGKGRGGRD